jgi:choline transporter-like protein 2/4/5
MAISSESFCSSALNSFILMLKNSAKFAFVEGFSEFFMFIAKLSIAIFTTATSLLILKLSIKESPVSSPVFPGIVILLVSFIVSGVFVQIFDTAANTILQCYLIDADVAKQRHLEPTHVPKTLARFLKTHGHDDHIEMMPESANLLR